MGAVPSGSPLRDIAWLPMHIGDGGVFNDPPVIFDEVASLAYQVLQKHDHYQSYLRSMNLVPIPSVVNQQADMRAYKRYLSVKTNVHSATLIIPPICLWPHKSCSLIWILSQVCEALCEYILVARCFEFRLSFSLCNFESTHYVFL